MTEQVNSAATRPRLPEWLKVRMPGGARYIELQNLMRDHQLHTVCQEAHCPNIANAGTQGRPPS